MWISKLWPLSLSDAYGMSDELFCDVISTSVVRIGDESQRTWCLEIITEEELKKTDNVLFTHVNNFECSPVPDIDWLAKSFENFKPVVIGKFYVYGSHTKLTQESYDKICLQINAANAFGSGEHPTTKGCIKAISSYFDKRKHNIALDLGCGSCILGMVLAKLGCKKVYAYDNDNSAVDVAKRNTEINHVSHQVTVLHNKATEFETRKYDIIVANILATPLVELSKNIVNSLNIGGVLILSGFTEQQTEVCKTYEANGLYLAKNTSIDGWITSIFEKL